MSWWIRLVEQDGQTAKVPPFSDGGTYALGGSDVAELNVTYNYGNRLRTALLDREPEKSDVLKRLFDGKSAASTKEMLAAAIATLGTKRDSNYWAPTAGNVGAALNILLGWALDHPTATWEVT